MTETCPFVGCECTGGRSGETWSGCGYKRSPGDACEQLADVPEGMTPRDWYIAQLMEIGRREGQG